MSNTAILDQMQDLMTEHTVLDKKENEFFAMIIADLKRPFANKKALLKELKGTIYDMGLSDTGRILMFRLFYKLK